MAGKKRETLFQRIKKRWRGEDKIFGLAAPPEPKTKPVKRDYFLGSKERRSEYYPQGANFNNILNRATASDSQAMRRLGSEIRELIRSSKERSAAINLGGKLITNIPDALEERWEKLSRIIEKYVQRPLAMQAQKLKEVRAREQARRKGERKLKEIIEANRKRILAAGKKGTKGPSPKKVRDRLSELSDAERKQLSAVVKQLSREIRDDPKGLTAAINQLIDGIKAKRPKK